MKIHNMRNDALKCRYIVIRIVNGAAWYYDAWDDSAKAVRQAVEIGGHVLPREAVEV